MRAVLLLGVLSIAAPVRPERNYPRAEEPKPLQEQIIGDWQLVKLAHGTPRMEHAINHNMVLRITPSETVFIVNGQPSQADGLTANYSIDWARNPIAIDFMPKQRGGKMPGILKLDGDTLIMGLTTGGDVRPADFASAQMLGHYKRVGK
jgi:uncharacterized protein (TIGR03067 family)